MYIPGIGNVVKIGKKYVYYKEKNGESGEIHASLASFKYIYEIVMKNSYNYECEI